MGNEVPTQQTPKWEGRETVHVYRNDGLVDTFQVDGSKGDRPPIVANGVAQIHYNGEAHTYPLTSIYKITTIPEGRP